MQNSAHRNCSAVKTVPDGHAIVAKTPILPTCPCKTPSADMHLFDTKELFRNVPWKCFISGLLCFELLFSFTKELFQDIVQVPKQLLLILELQTKLSAFTTLPRGRAAFEPNRASNDNLMLVLNTVLKRRLSVVAFPPRHVNIELRPA